MPECTSTSLRVADEILCVLVAKFPEYTFILCGSVLNDYKNVKNDIDVIAVSTYIEIVRTLPEIRDVVRVLSNSYNCIIDLQFEPLVGCQHRINAKTSIKIGKYVVYGNGINISSASYDERLDYIRYFVEIYLPNIANLWTIYDFKKLVFKICSELVCDIEFAVFIGMSAQQIANYFEETSITSREITENYKSIIAFANRSNQINISNFSFRTFSNIIKPTSKLLNAKYYRQKTYDVSSGLAVFLHFLKIMEIQLRITGRVDSDLHEIYLSEMKLRTKGV